MGNNFKIREIDSHIATPFFIEMHYAQRIPSISYLFGLYEKNVLVGVLSIGKPASASLCNGVCGIENTAKVYELNRLIVNEGLPKNTLSIFVSKVLKLLRGEDLIIVSYADTGAGHTGYIYQATNFIYTGVTKQRTDIYTSGLHARHSKVDSDNLRRVRTPKHRYIYFTDRSKVNSYLEVLNYEVLPYPKGDNSRYVLGARIPTHVLDTDSDLMYREYNIGSTVLIGSTKLFPNILDTLESFYTKDISVRFEFTDGETYSCNNFFSVLHSRRAKKIFKYKGDRNYLYATLIKYYVIILTLNNIKSKKLNSALLELSKTPEDIIFRYPSDILGAREINKVYLGCNLLGEAVKNLALDLAKSKDKYLNLGNSVDVTLKGSPLCKMIIE